MLLPLLVIAGGLVGFLTWKKKPVFTVPASPRFTTSSTLAAQGYAVAPPLTQSLANAGYASDRPMPISTPLAPSPRTTVVTNAPTSVYSPPSTITDPPVVAAPPKAPASVVVNNLQLTAYMDMVNNPSKYSPEQVKLATSYLQSVNAKITAGTELRVADATRTTIAPLPAAALKAREIGIMRTVTILKDPKSTELQKNAGKASLMMAMPIAPQFSQATKDAMASVSFKVP